MPFSDCANKQGGAGRAVDGGAALDVAHRGAARGLAHDHALVTTFFLVITHALYTCP